ncbi:hypothetical protein AV530_016199 [Patagioenas fasciata monilis]|uniref:Uncharacterized protein n=1 Tax=Patagioenas fasciata monilis TaxID=372326 RepID=A0A1V4JWL3_PATFA|nr:hypothetical protein AV530_016199 [Patagioenas fasciata monilis]
MVSKHHSGRSQCFLVICFSLLLQAISVNGVKHLSMLAQAQPEQERRAKATVSTKKPERTGAGKEVQGLKEMKMSEIAKPRCLHLQICCNGSRNDLSSAVVLPFTYH